MDRRQKKTRTTILKTFIELLYEKDFSKITVGEIIDRADVGRATFYSHFESKDFLLKSLCEDVFCHIIDSLESKSEHVHIISCDIKDNVFLHLFRHIKNNDSNMLKLLLTQNNELFFRYFRANLEKLVISQLSLFEDRKNKKLPDSFWIDHITSTFVDTLRWWGNNGMKESPENITEYFILAV